jgi:hypothetical protein
MSARILLATISLISFTQCQALQSLLTSWQQQSTTRKCLMTTGCTSGILWSYLQYRHNPFAKVFAATSVLSFGLLCYNTYKTKKATRPTAAPVIPSHDNMANQDRSDHDNKSSENNRRTTCGYLYITPYIKELSELSNSRAEYSNLHIKPQGKNIYTPMLTEYPDTRMLQVTAARRASHDDDDMMHNLPYPGFPYKCFPVKHLPLSTFVNRNPGDILYFKDNDLFIELHIQKETYVESQDTQNKGKTTYESIMNQYLS